MVMVGNWGSGRGGRVFVYMFNRRYHSKAMMVVEVIVVFVRRLIRVAVKLGRTVFISSITHNHCADVIPTGEVEN